MNFEDIASGESKSVASNAVIRFNADDRRRIDPLADASVRRNVTIADVAQGIKRMAELLEENKPKQAKKQLVEQLELAGQRYPMALDAEVVRTKDLAVRYMRKLDGKRK